MQTQIPTLVKTRRVKNRYKDAQEKQRVWCLGWTVLLHKAAVWHLKQSWKISADKEHRPSCLHQRQTQRGQNIKGPMKPLRTYLQIEHWACMHTHALTHIYMLTALRSRAPEQGKHLADRYVTVPLESWPRSVTHKQGWRLAGGTKSVCGHEVWWRAVVLGLYVDTKLEDMNHGASAMPSNQSTCTHVQRHQTSPPHIKLQDGGGGT